MRLLLTAVADGGASDVVVDCDDDAAIGDLAAGLADHLSERLPDRLPAGAAVTAAARAGAGAPGLRVVSEARHDPRLTPLWLEDRQLDPAEPLSTSSIRHGAVLAVGAPLPDMLREPIGELELRIAGGRGAGSVRRLMPGSYLIGSDPAGAVVLEDPAVPAVAARLDVDLAGGVTFIPDPAVIGRRRPAPHRDQPLTGPIVLPSTGPPARRRWWHSPRRRFADGLGADPHDTFDPQDDVPLVHLDRRAVDGPVRWQPGVALVVGDVLLELAGVTPPDASLSLTHGGATCDYNRPPRLLPPPRTSEFTLPSKPPKPDKTPLPLALLLAPALLAGGMYFLTRSVYSLLFAVAMPVMALSTFSSGRRASARSYKRQLTDFTNRTRRVRTDAYAALVAERALRRRDLADPATLLVTATGPRMRLWERRRTDPDWLLARIGTADVPSDVTVRDPARELHEGPLTWTAPDVPVSVSLAGAGVTGIAGPDALRRALGRWVVAQAAALHSPADLQIVLLADRSGAPDWSWARWLPQVRSADTAGPVVSIGTDPDAVQALVRDLLARLQQRASVASVPGQQDQPVDPVLVVLDGARRLRLLPGMVSLLQDGPRFGLYFLCLDADEQRLPEECNAVVSPAAPGSELLQVRLTGHADVQAVRPDLVGLPWCERIARALAPIRDVSSEDLAGSLPSSSRLLTVLGLTEPRGDQLAARWQRQGRTTRAVVGEGLDGPFSLDIRLDGPHGLVAGTTGSGKSELLQTMIASLAVGNRPDEMTFVLIDYKGGAAFKDCVALPHTVGMVTDLDGHLTTRALESLGAELRRREHQLAAARAKDIEEYLAGRGAGDDPMPRLLIVIDEFAALAAELPDFVVGLVDIARRGRSLGVHLILATQRPAGVVSAEIKSNTNLRIALRVTDANDSQDVLESGIAATVPKSTPGRAYARLGHSSLLPFQSSRVGGRPRGEGGLAAVRLRPFSWSTLAVPAPPLTDADEDDDVSIPTDLATLVRALGTAAEIARVQPPPTPWLPPLDDVVTIEEADDLAGAAVDGPAEIAPLAFGVVDVPSEQRRSAARWDVAAAGHLCFAGAPRTGRSTALRAVAGAVARHASPCDVHLYGVDCGNNALLPLLSLPHTGAVVSREQPDRLGRLTSRLLSTISERQQLLAERGHADVREQRRDAEPAQRLPYIVVLFDRWEGFVAAFDSVDAGRLIEEWIKILQEGAGVGVKVALTADRTALTGRISTLIDDKILLRLIDPADYSTIGLPVKQVPERIPPGRGFRAEGTAELQVALLTDDPSGSAQVTALHALGAAARARTADVPVALRPFRVDALPTRCSLSEAMASGQIEPLPAGQLPLAVGGDTLHLIGIDPAEHGPGVIIAGPRRTGRSTALVVLAEEAGRLGWPVVAITARQSPLRALPAGVATSFTPDADREQVSAALSALLAVEHSLLVIDDLELLGLDGWLPDLITDHVAALRDRESLIVAAGSLDDLTGVYRGPTVALKRSRSGLLLSPQTQQDGDLFGIRLPRSSVGVASIPGRGLLVRGGQYESVQVVLPS